MPYSVTRYHDISCGHRVVGHEGKCRFLHGHNYRVHFTCEPNKKLDSIGRVIDFGLIKELLCQWLEINWDHRLLLWEKDKDFGPITNFDPTIRLVPFNPTAENMAHYLVDIIGPDLLAGTDVVLTSVTIDETRKCSATYTR